jgi:hypothetical protein
VPLLLGYIESLEDLRDDRCIDEFSRKYRKDIEQKQLKHETNIRVTDSTSITNTQFYSNSIANESNYQ